jgi:hypothetical protein
MKVHLKRVPRRHADRTVRDYLLSVHRDEDRGIVRRAGVAATAAFVGHDRWSGLRTEGEPPPHRRLGEDKADEDREKEPGATKCPTAHP